MKASVLEEFEWRGLVYDKTEGLGQWLAEEKVSAYIGFDPTADSLHVGSLLPIMGLVRLQQYGHRPIALVGGGTGMIGDPSGKSKERNLLDEEQLAKNVEGIRNQLAKFLDFETKENPAKLVNNYDWLGKMNFIEFLRDVGKNFTVNYMMAKESVKRRINSEEGISYTEFTYMMLQAYDFYKLSQSEDCYLQMGGSDQWGNITAGIDYIRRQGGKKAHGLVFPLVTNSSGAKFGKSEEGNIWLDPEKTSPYRFYQFWLNSSDSDVLGYLKNFTMLDQDQIAELGHRLETDPASRAAQKRLAEEITRTVHGQEELDKVQRASKVMFGGSVEGLTAADISAIIREMPATDLARENFEGEGFWVPELLVSCGVTKSKGEARRLVTSGAVYVNNQRVADANHKIVLDQAIDGRFLVLRKGKKNYHLVKILS
ncbi:tyrosine--tRNA ligase [Sulfidibacter corallicola]|uniref:Tyrosine--tRNA ligase n=1 Tax=Sulfidibacter corallicola TaxID=2818388 RepID=A0A8A4TC67_SULCO|nr:tyrosine--tRNA ligase [Sulfidibacter corallicola]QTD47699.1 tyrosine--tRNA ligase [Sulfidibacter corallicola]